MNYDALFTYCITMLYLPTALRCSIYLLHYDAVILLTYCIEMLLFIYCITMLLCYLLHYDAIMLPTALRCSYLPTTLWCSYLPYCITMLLNTDLNYDALIYLLHLGLGTFQVERSLFPENERNDQERFHHSEKKRMLRKHS